MSHATPHARRPTTVAGCCLATFWSGAIAFGYPGVMGTVWQGMFGVGTGATGLVVTVMLLGISAGTLVSGPFLRRHGMRACIGLGTALVVVAMAVLMCAGGIALVYVWAFVVSLGASFVYGPGLTTAQLCLPRRKGLASGLLNLTFGLSAALMGPVWEWALGAFGYRAVNLSLVACVLLTNAAAALMVGARRPRPEQQRRSPDVTTPRQAMRTRGFWLLWGSWALVGAAGICMVSLSKSYASAAGIPAVAMLSAFNLTNAISRLVTGVLCDVVGGARAAGAAFAVGAVGYALLPLAQGPVASAALAACVGYGFGSLFAACGPIASGLFGAESFGGLFGLVFAAYGCVGGVIGPLAAGAVLEATGGAYAVVFAYLAVFMGAGALLMAALGREEKGSVREGS